MSIKIPVFTAEIEAGVGELVMSNASIAVAMPIQTIEKSASDELWNRLVASRQDKILAGLKDGDLYGVRSILASSNWNRNDDIFDRHEMWMARATPIHKPDNINHNETDIVGHIVDCWAVDAAGNVIPDDIAADKLPDLYHIVNSSVIYTVWTKQEQNDKIRELIAKIEAGKMFVSMECLFRGFDYGVQTPDGEQKLIERNESTAFLTKHLRAYGGTGMYQDYKIGRVMRRMTFSGKGYVETPANPDSIILSSENNSSFMASAKINTVFEEKGVLILCKANTTKQEISNMSDTTNKVLEDAVAELKAQLAAAVAENKKLAESQAKASIDALESAKKDATEKLEAANKALEAAKNEVAAAKTAHTELSAKLEASEKAKAELESQVNKAKADALTASRVNTLIAGGISEEEAKATVAKFATLDDAQFATIAELAIKAAFPMKDDEKKKKDEKECAGKDKKAKADADLDNAEPEKGQAALGGTGDAEDKGGEELRKSLAGLFESFGIGTTVKGDA